MQRPADVFIHSSQHSGSTWLGYVLGSGPESAFVGELSRAWDSRRRVPCTVCASRGLDSCVLLGGIEDVPPAEAFSVIARRSCRRVIVDNSKEIAWTRRFLGRPDRDTRIIHIIKDPRSLWASVRRRNAGGLDQCLSGWCAENRLIMEFCATSGAPALVAAYDIVAADQAAEMPALFAFAGMAFTADALEYWRTEHHGFAANGASSALVRHQEFTAPPAHFATGDDAFYNTAFGRPFVDRRWRAELPPAESGAILANADVRQLLLDLGYRLTPEGVARCAGAGPRSWLARAARMIGW